MALVSHFPLHALPSQGPFLDSKRCTKLPSRVTRHEGHAEREGTPPNTLTLLSGAWEETLNDPAPRQAALRLPWGQGTARRATDTRRGGRGGPSGRSHRPRCQCSVLSTDAGDGGGGAAARQSPPQRVTDAAGKGATRPHATQEPGVQAAAGAHGGASTAPSASAHRGRTRRPRGTPTVAERAATGKGARTLRFLEVRSRSRPAKQGGGPSGPQRAAGVYVKEAGKQVTGAAPERDRPARAGLGGGRAGW